MYVYFLIFISFFCLPTSQSTAIILGGLGRWCAQGRYDMTTGILGGYDDDHYCGLWNLWCVSISYSDNTTRFDCDNAGGIFPKCDHDEKYSYCYQKEDLYICCCPDDDCNDCSKHPRSCINPLALITTTTSTSTTTTTTTTTTPPPPIPSTTTTTTPPPVPSTTAISNVQNTTPLLTERNNFDLTTTSIASIIKLPVFNIIISFCIFVLNYC